VRRLAIGLLFLVAVLFLVWVSLLYFLGD